MAESINQSWILFDRTLTTKLHQKSTPAGIYFDVAMATHSVSDLYYAGTIIPFFELNKTLSVTQSLIRGPSVIWALYMFLNRVKYLAL